MADKKLKVLVTVHDEQGVAHLFGPNDTLPGWARKKITNPNVWDGDDAAEVPVPTPEPNPTPEVDGEKSADEPDESDETDDESDDETDGVVTDGAPPRAGKGSSLDNWKTWADEQGVQYPDDVKKGDLIALVDAAAAASKE
jgi:hypothetical protein